LSMASPGEFVADDEEVVIVPRMPDRINRLQVILTAINGFIFILILKIPIAFRLKI